MNGKRQPVTDNMGSAYKNLDLTELRQALIHYSKHEWNNSMSGEFVEI